MRKTEASSVSGAMRGESRQRPIRSLARPFSSPPWRSVDEGERAGLLASRSSYSPRLTAMTGSPSGTGSQWQKMRLSSLVTAAQPPGISSALAALSAPGSLFSHGHDHGHSFAQRPQYIVGVLKNCAGNSGHGHRGASQLSAHTWRFFPSGGRRSREADTPARRPANHAANDARKVCRGLPRERGRTRILWNGSPRLIRVIRGSISSERVLPANHSNDANSEL